MPENKTPFPRNEETPESPPQTLGDSFLSAVRAEFPADFISRDPAVLKVYGADWSGVLEPAPSAVVFPRSTDEVSRFLKFCLSHRVKVVPSGGRTGLSGGAVAARGEIVLSLKRMDRIDRLSESARTLVAQAGAITQAVHDFSAPFGLTWPVDFASKGSSTIGGNIATNAGGVRVIRYGLTRNWVLGLTVVSMDGTIHELNGSLEKNNTGPDLRQLMIGSEGIFGVITEAVLKLAPLVDAERSHVAFFSLADIRAVTRLFAEARRRPLVISAFECLDAPSFESSIRSGLRNPFQAPAPAYALMEFEEGIPGAADLFLDACFHEGWVSEGTLAQSSREKTELWAIRECVAESIMQGSEVHQQDLSVPIDALDSFFNGIEARYRVSYPEFAVFIFGHIGDGNLHIFIRKPASLPSAEFHAACSRSDEELFSLTQKFHGSISAEHGIGILKKSALRYSKTPAEIALMRGIKRLFDPECLMNPGKVLDEY